MSKTKTKRTTAAPQVQAPRARHKPASKRWLLWLAASTPLILGVVLALAFWPSGEEASAPAARADAAQTPASLPDAPDYHSLLVTPADPRHILLGTHNGLFESTDAGRTWSAASLEGQDAMNLARAGGKTVWAAGHEVLARSSDGGKSWQDVYPEGLPSRDVHGFAVDPENPRHLFAAVAGQGLFESTDAGKSFRLFSSQVGGGVMAVGVTPGGRILAGDMRQGLLVSDDRGQSWRSVLQDGVMGLALNPRDPRRGLATARGIFLTTDGGATWRSVLPVPAGAGPVAWVPGDSRTAYVVGFDRLLYRSRDRGVSWEPVS